MVTTTQSLASSSCAVGFGFCSWILRVTRYAMPLHVFPKHHTLRLNAKVSARSAIKKNTMCALSRGIYLADIIFLRDFASSCICRRRPVAPLRGCNWARPLHDMSKYFNPFFPNTLAVQSEIAFWGLAFLSTTLMHLHNLVAKMSSAVRFNSLLLKFSNGIL